MIELGQFLTGAPVREYEMQPRVLRLLEDLEEELAERGIVLLEGCFANPTFLFRRHSWGESDEPNFRCGDFEACWYKHLGRSGTQNRLLSIGEIEKMRAACRRSLFGEYADAD